MMNNIAIKVNNLSKIYKLYDKPQDRLKEALNPFKKSYHKDFHALNDVSFEIKRGETVGIIGKNGAGKSTLLKIITGVLTPTSGHVHINGRIASLLELGSGFNPEYTGIENIYLQGTLMGFSHEKMATKMDEILAFADIGDFIHQPVRMYSSGMFARLAFAVAINVEPDILIVDEALSVGDMYFQQKCMDKINSMRSRKMTLLFVSHSIGQVKKICEKAVYIENGTLITEGESRKVCDLYLNQSTSGAEKEKINALEKAQNEDKNILKISSSLDVNKFFRRNQDFDKQYTERSGGRELEFLSLDIYDENNTLLTEVTSMSNIKIVASCIANENISEGFVIGLLCRDQNGNDMFACNSNHYNIGFDSIKSETEFIVEWVFNFPLLHGIDGIYTFSLGAKPEPMSSYFYDRIFNALVVKVNNPIGFENVGGVVFVKPFLKIIKKEMLHD